MAYTQSGSEKTAASLLPTPHKALASQAPVGAHSLLNGSCASIQDTLTKGAKASNLRGQESVTVSEAFMPGPKMFVNFL